MFKSTIGPSRQAAFRLQPPGAGACKIGMALWAFPPEFRARFDSEALREWIREDYWMVAANGKRSSVRSSSGATSSGFLPCVMRSIPCLQVTLVYRQIPEYHRSWSNWNLIFPPSSGRNEKFISSSIFFIDLPLRDFTFSTVATNVFPAKWILALEPVISYLRG